MAIFDEREFGWRGLLNRLKFVPRTGWIEIGVPKEMVESVYAHIASTKDMAREYNSRYNLQLNMDKMDKMITIKELVKAYTKEEKSVISGETSKEKNRNIILAIQQEFDLPQEYVDIYDEYEKQQSKEAKYTLYFSKFESDLQVVQYYESGYITLEAVYKDVEYYPEDIKKKALKILEEYPIPPLAWLTYDSTYYKGNELFESLSNQLISYCISKELLKKEEKGNVLK